MLGDARAPLPPAPGRSARRDPEHARGGVATRFLVAEPRRGRRRVRVSGQRTRIDFAHCVKEPVDGHYPLAEKAVLVLDRPNTPSPASLDEAFAPPEAKRLADKPEIHHTPKHGSWLNMAELEPSALQRQCLAKRMRDRSAVARAAAAWAAARNEAAAVDWRFTTADARVRLRRLYPAVHD